MPAATATVAADPVTSASAVRAPDPAATATVAADPVILVVAVASPRRASAPPAEIAVDAVAVNVIATLPDPELIATRNTASR